MEIFIKEPINVVDNLSEHYFLLKDLAINPMRGNEHS